jgi:hypothetical protein
MNIQRDYGAHETVMCKEPKKIYHRSLEFGAPKTTVQNVLHKCLRLRLPKIQLGYEIKASGHPKLVAFADFMCSEIDDNEGYLQQVMFTVKTVFHITGCISHYNCRIWGAQQPNKLFAYMYDTLKVNEHMMLTIA